jgi:serine/threonine-protein kinase
VKTSDPRPPVEQGQVLAGKYAVEQVLGMGGMGVVVAARHVQLGTRVALKFLRPEACANPTTATRFLREARAAANLQGEHVVRVTDVGTLDSGAPYMVMELLHGGDLATALAARGPLPIDQAALHVIEACLAVAEAHALGIVHRDIKPANLFLAQRADGSSCLKVLDFGVSKTPSNLHEGSDSAGVATGTGAALGTPYYMSPEQIRSARDVDGRTDVWALGVVLYELLTGRRPFEAQTLPAVFVAITNDAPVTPRSHRPDLPVELERVVLACLEKVPAHRVPTVAELAHRLAPFAPRGSEGLVERAQRLGRGPVLQANSAPAALAHLAPTQAATAGAWESEKRGARRGRWVLVATGVTAAVVIAGAAVTVPRIIAGRKAAATRTLSSTPSVTAPQSDSSPPPTTLTPTSTPASPETSAAPAPSASLAASTGRSSAPAKPPASPVSPPRKKDETSKSMQ